MRAKSTGRLLLAAFLAANLAAYWALHLDRYLTLENLKNERLALEGLYAAHPAGFLGAYAAIYVISTALSIPGATVLTLAAAALFGFWRALLLVSVSSTLGATLAFWIARFLLRDFVQARFGARLNAINEGIRREGVFYLAALRLVPVFPFFLINLAMGLTPISAVEFFVVSQLAMLPGTAVYVNAGTRLAELHSLRGILSPGLLLSFAAVGLLPLISKGLLGAFRRRKALRRFRRPRRFDYNVVAIGGGAAGLVTAYISAAVRARVALVERERLGGDCLYTGCVPSKTLLRTARVCADLRRAERLGLKAQPSSVDLAEVMARVRRAIAAVEPHDSPERYRSLGVDCLEGEARIRSPFEVEVGSRVLTTRNIVIATGARPFVPPLPGLHDVGYRTSETIWALKELPRRLLVLGGGAVGCELGQAFARLGSEVTLVEAAPRLLAREEPEASKLVKRALEQDGVRVVLGATARGFERHGPMRMAVCDKGGQELKIEFDELLVALGRRPRTTGFGLEELGVELAKDGTVAHDAFLRTSIPNIYVCGDVAGPYQFTHAAAHQAWYASVNALFSPFKSFRVDYGALPWATFTDPEVARVGLSEGEARAQGVAFEVTTYDVADLDRAIVDEEARGFVKVLTRAGTDKILGVTIVASHASEAIAEFVTALRHGLGLNKVLSTTHIYPTFSEMNRYAAGQWKKAHAPERALRWLARFHSWRRS